MKFGIDYGTPGGDYTMVTIADGIYVQTVRYDVLMACRWYKTPIKWLRYRKLIKVLKTNEEGGKK